ncbi:hypothetical protein NTGHW29_280043 [Candidatus Nitrotoga sp. HW29]|uniref:hypothetical protein n=1 Tax=Candidatus Nitrotoga sp. HW29 TaxID=2886963 RepID=UPI001EF1829C|nr:hypothetical protein [Candidatus Nitrotoga sp. HW29]CAH1904389.1 hypothetical protein NTGHW29_280043 [Candidatus Nitrotoga sp. HW29]
MITHKNPLSPTLVHYIEKNSLGQAIKLDFSLRDKQLELKVDVVLISLIKNGLRKKAKAFYDVCWIFEVQSRRYQVCGSERGI